MKDKRSLLKKILKSSFGVFTSRIFGLIRDLVIAAYFGASKQTDAFFVAFAIPNLFRALFAEGALSSAFVPLLAEARNESVEKANSYMTLLICYLFVILSIVTLLIIFFSKYIILIFLPGYINDTEMVTLGANLLKIVMPYLLFVSIASIFAGFLNLMGSYFIPYSSTTLLNISMILGAIVGYNYGQNIFYIAYGVFLGGVLQLLLVFLYSNFHSFKFTLNLKTNSLVKSTFLLIIPSIFGVGISQLNFTVGRIVASFLNEGSISYLYYANRLFQFPLGVFSVALSAVALAELSKSNVKKDVKEESLLIDKSIIAIFLIIIPASIGLVILSDEITALVYQRNRFTDIDVKNTSAALIMYSVGLIFYSFVNLFTKVFHSRKDTKTPVKVAAISFLLNLIFMLLLIKWLSHAGIALASSIASLFNATILYYLIKDYKFRLKEHILAFLKIVFSTICMVFVIFILKKFHLNVLIVITISAISYFLILYILKVNYRGLFR